MRRTSEGMEDRERSVLSNEGGETRIYFDRHRENRKWDTTGLISDDTTREFDLTSKES